MRKGSGLLGLGGQQQRQSDADVVRGLHGLRTDRNRLSERFFGGLDIDNKGNIVSLDSVFGKAMVYSGCNPACSVVSGPYTLQGNAIYGHLNKQAMTFAAADFINGQIDVYKYHQGTFNYWYSFNNGLSAFNGVEGVTYSPRSRQ